MLKELEQITIEDKYSRKNIYTEIKKELDSEQESILFKKCVTAIRTYANKEYYSSKTKRVQQMKLFIQPEDIVLEVFILVLPIQHISPIQQVVGQLGNKLGLSVIDGIKCAAEILAVLVNTGLFDIFTSNTSNIDTLGIKSNYSMNKSIQDYIKNTKHLLPLICKPRNRIHNSGIGGYLSITSSVILGKQNNHNKPLNLDIVNILQDIQWEIDIPILAYEEQPSKPLDTLEKKENFLRIKNQTSIALSDLTAKYDNEFYFEWKYDSRGRIYSSGYLINIQGNEYRKALLNFKNKEKLTGV